MILYGCILVFQLFQSRLFRLLFQMDPFLQVLPTHTYMQITLIRHFKCKLAGSPGVPFLPGSPVGPGGPGDPYSEWDVIHNTYDMAQCVLLLSLCSMATSFPGDPFSPGVPSSPGGPCGPGGPELPCTNH